jgi:hypothetical protein
VSCFTLYDEYAIYVRPQLVQIYRGDLSSQYRSMEIEDSRCIAICADKDRIFIMAESNKVYCYTWNFQRLKTFGQRANARLPFYFRFVEQMDIRTKKLYTRSSRSITIFNETTGIILKTIYIESYKFIIKDREKQLIAFTLHGIFRYELESGDFISQTNTNFIEDGYKILDYKDDKYLLLSKNKKELFYCNI